VKRVVVDRATWLHGEGSMASKLQRRGDNKRCCVGFACIAYGVPEDQLLGHSSPLVVAGLPHSFDKWNFDPSNTNGYRALHAAFAINDCIVGQRPGSTSGGSSQYSETVEVIKKYGADDRGAAPIKDDADREARLVALFADRGIELVFDGEYPAPPAPEGEVTP
jgi:hypothetical protein